MPNKSDHISGTLFNNTGTHAHSPSVEEDTKKVKEIAIQAGKLIIAAWGRSKQFDCKDGKSNDLVTQTDRQVEQFIFTALRDAFPDICRFLGEEECSGEGGVVSLGDEATWVVDPIDGTTNFVHKYHHYILYLYVHM